MSDYYAPSRFRPAHVRPVPARPRGRTIAETWTDPIAVLRIQAVYDRADTPHWTVDAWTATHRPVTLDPAQQQLLFDQWRQRFPAINWWRPHQVDLRGPRASIGAAPYAEDDGGIPELDDTFGPHRTPVLADHTTPPLPFAAPEQTRRAA